MSRYATRHNKRDASEPEIIAALSSVGVQWHEGGPLDGWVHFDQWFPVEIKTAKGKLTLGQKLFISDCELRGRRYKIWRTGDDAVNSVMAWRHAQ